MKDLGGLGYRGATVVISGAYSGMGEATARILGDLGARLHVVDVKKPSIPHEAFYETDLSQTGEVSRTADALRSIGPIDFVFACAGIAHTFGALKCMLVNYIGTRQLIEGILPAVRNGAGIAIISSDSGMGWQQHIAQNLELLAISDPAAARRWCEEKPEAIRDGYTVSKEMLIVWVQHRSITLGKERGIRINCTGPCPTRTPFMDETVKALGADYFEQYPYPLLGRSATPEEQAWPLVLLNSPLNAVVTGSLLYTDQGVAGGLFTRAMDVSSIMPKGVSQ
jgi:NAD(P)-dependent dehydrogenase (short-subunit alcohol dehydrogenase family)